MTVFLYLNRLCLIGAIVCASRVASGSSECLDKPPCTAEHFIMYFTPCTTGKVSESLALLMTSRKLLDLL